MVAKLANQKRATIDIQISLRRSRGFVQRWAYAYRGGEIEALKDKPRGESVAKINSETALKLKARIDAGSTLVNRVFDDYQHLLDTCAQAWQRLTPELLRFVCACPYLSHENDA